MNWKKNDLMSTTIQKRGSKIAFQTPYNGAEGMHW